MQHMNVKGKLDFVHVKDKLDLCPFFLAFLPTHHLFFL